MTLIEVMVACSISCVVALMVYAFYRNWMEQMNRQKLVEHLQSQIREARQSIDKYLVSSGVAGDSLFFDPHRLLTGPVQNGGVQVFQVSSDSQSLMAYGNYSGEVVHITEPVINKSDRAVKVDNPSALESVDYVYITAGSAQEVAKVSGVSANGTIRFSHDLWVPYPKGSLIFPLERVSIRVVQKNQLHVSRENAQGKAFFKRTFEPSGMAGDSVAFRIRGMNRLAGQLEYQLAFAAKTRGRSPALLVREAEQTLLVRGY
jgi:type II secretory pathway pseudopilin PulG